MNTPRKDSEVEKVTIQKIDTGHSILVEYSDGKKAEFSCDNGTEGYDLKEAFVAVLLQVYKYPAGGISKDIRKKLFVDNVTDFTKEQ